MAARSLGQAQCCLSAVKGDENEEPHFEEIKREYTKGPVCLTMKTTDFRFFVFRSISNNFKRIITFGPETYHLRTTVAIGLTHASTVFNSFSSSFGTFLVRNVKYKIMFTLVLFCELYKISW